MRRATAENLHLARRAARLAGLCSIGVPEDTADQLVAAWEAKADAEGRLRGTAAYWAGAEEELRRRWAARPSGFPG